MADAETRIIRAAVDGEGLSVVTVNTHHLRLAGRDPDFACLLGSAGLSVADGWPLVLASRIAGHPLPSRVTGADLVASLLLRRRWRLAILGGPPGVAEDLAATLHGQAVVLIDPLPAPEWQTAEYQERLATELGAVAPELVLIGVGAPRQEDLGEWLRQRVPAVYIGCGATLEFLSGRRVRAPRWVQRIGLEWAFRAAQEPRRLAPRYACAARSTAALFVALLVARARKL
jgi:N-acetylglucosaminyldiphosphoundecaprenol N-acetyl-beta-D-mannosaminyltransferase